MEDLSGYERLCREVERKTGRTISAASDFSWLAEQIMEQVHEQLSTSTLMRLWGYRSGGTPRKSTLDILARYLGYGDYAAFVAAVRDDDIGSNEGTENTEKSGMQPDSDVQAESQTEDVAKEDAPAAVVRESAGSRLPLYIIIGLLLLIIAGLFYWLPQRQEAEPSAPEEYVLRKGEWFPDNESYLKFFGITNLDDEPWSKPLPHHQNIIIFGGQYHHPRWGNEGDTTDLLPTRTERWHDESLPPEVSVMQNRQHYYTQKQSNRLAITFMKDIRDSGYVFCGVYRMSLELSDTTHVVWERVADEVDLLHIDALEQFRN